MYDSSMDATLCTRCSLRPAGHLGGWVSADGCFLVTLTPGLVGPRQSTSTYTHSNNKSWSISGTHQIQQNKHKGWLRPIKGVSLHARFCSRDLRNASSLCSCCKIYTYKSEHKQTEDQPEGQNQLQINITECCLAMDNTWIHRYNSNKIQAALKN